MSRICNCDLTRVEVTMGANIDDIDIAAIVHAKRLVSAIRAGDWNIEGLVELAMPTHAYPLVLGVDLGWVCGWGLFLEVLIPRDEHWRLAECSLYAGGVIGNDLRSLSGDSIAVVHVADRTVSAITVNAVRSLVTAEVVRKSPWRQKGGNGHAAKGKSGRTQSSTSTLIDLPAINCYGWEDISDAGSVR